jgi:hypothetical protein
MYKKVKYTISTERTKWGLIITHYNFIQPSYIIEGEVIDYLEPYQNKS